MYPDSPFAHPISSFQFPAPVPTVDPDAGSLISVCLNPAWLPYIIGSLKQLLLESTWDTTDPDVLALTQERVFNLIDLFQPGICPGEGTTYSHTFDTSAGLVDWVPFEDDFEGNHRVWGTWVPGLGWFHGDPLTNAVYLRSPVQIAGTINFVRVVLDRPNPCANPTAYALNGNTVYDTIHGAEEIYNFYTGTVIGSDYLQVWVGNSESANSDEFAITSITVNGAGLDPFG